MGIYESVSCFCPYFQDGFLLQPFDKDDQATQDQAEKEDDCTKTDKLEKMQRKMLSRGKRCNAKQKGLFYVGRVDFMLYIIICASYELAFVFMSLTGCSVYQDFEVRILLGGSGVAGKRIWPSQSRELKHFH